MRKAFARAEEVNFDNQLDIQLGLAHKLIVQLETLEKLRHAVLNVDILDYFSISLVEYVESNFQ
jgi:hypothetical protein